MYGFGRAVRNHYYMTKKLKETSPFCPDTSDDTGSHSLISLLRSRNVLIILVIFIAPAFRPTTTHVLLQYMSSRFQWKLSQSTVFISEIAIINIILYLLVLPRVTHWIETRFKIPQEVIDLAVVRGSLLLLVVGALLLSCAAKAIFIIPGPSFRTIGSYQIVTTRVC